MSGNKTVAVRRPPTPATAPPARMVQVRREIVGSPDQVSKVLAVQEAEGRLVEHTGSVPARDARGRLDPRRVVVNAVLLEPVTIRPVAGPNRTRTAVILLTVTGILLAGAVTLGYLAFVNTATALAGEARGLLGIMVVAALITAWLSRGRKGAGGSCGCGCTVIHICRPR